MLIRLSRDFESVDYLVVNLKRSMVILLLLGGLVICCSQPSLAQRERTYQQESGVRFGIAGTLGAGLFVAQEKAYYLDIKTDLYPEAGLMVDFWMLRTGVKAGLIYRKLETWSFGPYGEYYDIEYTRAFIPLQLDLLLAPLSGSFVTPYGGISPGVFLAVGDNSQHLPAVSVKLGMELATNFLSLYGDLRYTYADDDAINAGGIMLVIGGGLRLGRG